MDLAKSIMHHCFFPKWYDKYSLCSVLLFVVVFVVVLLLLVFFTVPGNTSMSPIILWLKVPSCFYERKKD